MGMAGGCSGKTGRPLYKSRRKLKANPSTVAVRRWRGCTGEVRRHAGDAIVSGGFAVFWNAFVAVWTVGALAGGGVLMALFSIPFWAAGFSMTRWEGSAAAPSNEMTSRLVMTSPLVPRAKSTGLHLNSLFK